MIKSMKRKIEEKDLEKMLKDIFLQPPFEISQADVDEGWAKVKKRIVEAEEREQDSKILPTK